MNHEQIAKSESLPILIELLDTTQSANKRFDTIVCRLGIAREKLFGAEPETAANGATAPQPPGAVLALRVELDKFHTYLSETERLLTQIERFV